MVEALLFSPDEAVEELMECCRVVVVACVAQLVEYDKLAQMLGQEHHIERYGDAIIAAT